MFNPLHRFSQHYTKTLFWSSSLLTLSSANFDESSFSLCFVEEYELTILLPFDTQAFSQCLALNQFIKVFGDCNAKGTCALNNVWLSLFNSERVAWFRMGAPALMNVPGLNFIGFAAGILVGTWLQSRYGRRLTIGVMNVIPFISTTIMLTSVLSGNRWQLLAGRIVHFLYAVSIEEWRKTRKLLIPA